MSFRRCPLAGTEGNPGRLIDVRGNRPYQSEHKPRIIRLSGCGDDGRRPRFERAPTPWTDGYSNGIGSYRELLAKRAKEYVCRRQILPKFRGDALRSIRQKKEEKMVGKPGGLEERKREVQKQIADVERSLNLISSGQLAGTAQDKIRLQKKLDITRRHLRALNES
jgi:hypothetical protein